MAAAQEDRFPPRKEIEGGRRKKWPPPPRSFIPRLKKKARAQTEMTGRGGGTRCGRLSAQQRHLGNLGVISGNLG